MADELKLQIVLEDDGPPMSLSSRSESRPEPTPTPRVQPAASPVVQTVRETIERTTVEREVRDVEPAPERPEPEAPEPIPAFEFSRQGEPERRPEPARPEENRPTPPPEPFRPERPATRVETAAPSAPATATAGAPAGWKPPWEPARPTTPPRPPAEPLPRTYTPESIPAFEHKPPPPRPEPMPAPAPPPRVEPMPTPRPIPTDAEREKRDAESRAEYARREKRVRDLAEEMVDPGAGKRREYDATPEGEAKSRLADDTRAKKVRDLMDPSAAAAKTARAPYDKAGAMLDKAGLPGGGLAKAGGDLAGAAAGGMGKILPALAIADEVGKAIAGVFNGVASSAKAAGEGMVKLARNDSLGAVIGVANKVAESLGKIPIIGQVWEAEIKAATAVVGAFADTVQAFVDRGRELSRYNADLAGSNAMADVKSLLADIREAGELGPGLARLTDAQADLGVAFREIMLPIKKFVVERLAEIMERLADWTGRIADSMDEIMERFKLANYLLYDLVTLSPLEALKDIRESSDAIRKIQEGAEDRRKRKDAETTIGMFDKMMDDLMNAAMGSPLRPDNAPTPQTSFIPRGAI